MQRRVFLGSSLGFGVVSTAGCLFGVGGRTGVNGKLEIANDFDERVSLRVTVDRNEPAGSQNLETVFEEDVSVPAKQTETLEVLGDDQFRITVAGLGDGITFWTRPICDAARTAVIITGRGELRNEVEDCE